jgi:hypothetical protein
MKREYRDDDDCPVFDSLVPLFQERKLVRGKLMTERQHYIYLSNERRRVRRKTLGNAIRRLRGRENDGEV